MVEVMVEGMSCENCAGHVRAALARLPGVTAVRVDQVRGRAELDAGAEVADQAIVDALDAEGYVAVRITRT